MELNSIVEGVEESALGSKVFVWRVQGKKEGHSRPDPHPKTPEADLRSNRADRQQLRSRPDALTMGRRLNKGDLRRCLCPKLSRNPTRYHPLVQELHCEPPVPSFTMNARARNQVTGYVRCAIERSERVSGSRWQYSNHGGR